MWDLTNKEDSLRGDLFWERVIPWHCLWRRCNRLNVAPAAGLATVLSLQPDSLWSAYFFGQRCKKLRRFTRVWNGLDPWIK